MEEIRVPVKNGNLVAVKSIDPDYPGLCIFFETNEGSYVDIAVIEAPLAENKEKINVYLYENECVDDWTNKFSLNGKDIYKAVEEEWKD